MSFLVALPYVSEADRDACVASMSREFKQLGLLVDNTVENRGVAASWNMAARGVLARGLDWLVCCSTSTRFGPEGGSDLVRWLDWGARWKGWLVVEPLPPVGWHCIAWRRELLERVGLFDENFWPAYGEDIDWSHRVLASQRFRTDEWWAKVPVDAWITMQGASVQQHGVVPRSDENFGYLERKWGDRSRRVFDHPFDDPSRGLDYWPEPSEGRL